MSGAGAWASPRLESRRLALEPTRPEHADELAPVLDDVALHRFIGGRPDSVVALRARLERQAAGQSPDGQECWLNWTVRLRATGEAVGTMQSTLTDGAPETVAELAWVIGVAHQGQGLAKEAVALVVAWLRTRGVSRLRAHIHPDHDASMGVARSAGLVATEVIKDGEVRWESPSESGPAPGRRRRARTARSRAR